MLCNISLANTWVWTGGGGANGNWNNSANWGSAGIPGNGDTVVFQGATGLLNTNNISNLTLSQIRFLAGGFDIRGYSFTLTNSIMATNGTGAITIECTNITLATSDVLMVVSNGLTLTIASQLQGTVGVIKGGAGTLAYTAPAGENSYTGTTAVNMGLLTITSLIFDGAFGGPLVIGDGSGTTATVRLLLDDEIPNNVPITINLNGTLDLNNFPETIGTLILSGGTVTSGTATLNLVANDVVTVSNGYTASISGNLNNGSGTMTVQGSGTLYLSANISGLANIVQNGLANTVWYGSNSYLGNLTDNGAGYIDLHNSFALGNVTNQLYLNGSALLAIADGISVTNQTVTFNNVNTGAFSSYGSIYSYNGSNSLRANFVLDNNCIVNVYTNCGLVFNTVGSLSGVGGFTKTGPGSMTLSGAGNSSSYTGNTYVDQGNLYLNSVNVIRYGTLMIGDGVGGPQSDVVRYLSDSCIYGGAGGSIVVITNSGWLDLNGFSDDVGPIYMDGAAITTGTGTLTLFQPLATIQSINGGSTISGNFNLNGPSTLTVTNDLTISAIISGSSSYTLTKAGLANLYLSGANTYSGLTVVQQGYLHAQNNLALGSAVNGTVVSNTATLVLDNGVTITNESLTLNGPGATSLWGSLDVESGINTWAGPITNNANSTLDAWNSGSALHINGPISGSGSLELFGYSGGGGTHYFDGSLSNSYAGLTTVDSGSTLVLNKSISNGALPGNLVVNSGGTARLGASVEMQKNTDILINGGGLFDTGIYWDQINTLHGSGTMNFGVNGWIEVGWSNGTSVFNGPMTGTGYTIFGYTVAKYGTGSFTMNGNSSFTSGAIHVFGGTVIENGITAQTPAIVESGATFGGSGTVGIVTANGTISPGNNGAGILSCSNVTFSATGHYTVDLNGQNPGTGYDQLNVSGTVSLGNAGLTINMPFGSPVAVGQQLVIINNDAADSITGTFLGVPEGTIYSLNGFNIKLSYVGGTGNDAVFTVLSVPGATVSSSVTSGDGSHGIDPNGCNNFSLAITNLTSSVMNNVTATLSTTTEGVIITQPYANYPNISGHGTGTNSTPFQISALPSFTCGTPIALQLSVKTSLGAFTVNYTLNSGEVAVVPSRYDISGNVAIPDIGSIDSTNIVAGFVATPIQKVVVSLYITHPFDSDLTNISLISPDNTTVLLSSANGGSGANYGSALSPDSSRTTFDDAAGTAITSGSAPFVGSFRPQSPLSAYTGNFTANGSWHLHIADGYGGSLGTLRGWSLFLYGNTCNSGSGSCDYCMTSISGTVTNTSLIQTNRIFRNGITASCGAAKSWPGGADSLGRHYDIYAFTNTTASDACVTAVLISTGDLQAGIYLNGFNPTNIQANYLADSGSSTGNNINNPQSCSATIPSGTVFYVTIDEVTPNAGGAYALQLSGLPCPPPTLNIQPVSGNQARLYWDTSGGGYVLESVSNLTANAWGGVTNEPMVNGGYYNVTNTTAVPSTNRFYRLRMP